MNVRQTLRLLLLSALSLPFISCDFTPNDDGNDNNNNNGGNQNTAVEDDYVGTWAMHRGTTAAGEIAVYLHLRPTKSLLISNAPSGAGQRMTGTWSVQDNGELLAPFANPPTGNGRIEAKITGNQLDIWFVEYWHTPNKVVRYTGTRVTGGLVPHIP